MGTVTVTILIISITTLTHWLILIHNLIFNIYYYNEMK